MDEREMEELEKQVPQVAVEALNAAHQRAVASGMPMVLVIDGGLYRVSGTGERELIRMLPPWTRAHYRSKREQKS